MSKLLNVLKRVKNNDINIEDALAIIKGSGYDDLGFAKIDQDRGQRKGFPEVVLCESKTVEQVVKIMEKLTAKNDNILASRAGPEYYHAVKKVLPSVRYNSKARFIICEKKPLPRVGAITVVSGGTGDLPVVEEVKETVGIMGNKVKTLVYGGTAGIHYLFENMHYFKWAKVIVVAAGMNGTLASIIAGQVNKPVIAVPTSAGYGTNLSGMAPLLTMLNSCSAGVGVVNIDNGFGAGYLANIINKIGENTNMKGC